MENHRRASPGIAVLVSGFCLSTLCFLPVVAPARPYYVEPNSPQPLVDAIMAAYNAPYAGIVGSSRPGSVVWAKRTPEILHIVESGDRAIPILIGNLDNDRLKYTAIRALGDLKAKTAVPELVERLEMCDSAHDLAIMHSLADITGLDSYQRFWFDYQVRVDAVTEYSTWCKTHGLRVPTKVDAYAADWADLHELLSQQQIDVGVFYDNFGKSGSDHFTAPVNKAAAVLRTWLRKRNRKLITYHAMREGDTVTLLLTWVKADVSR